MVDEFVYAGRDLEVLADMPRYYDWITDILGPYARGDAVEYGAGLGAISSRLVERVDTYVLAEPSKPLAKLLSERFSSQSKVTVVPHPMEVHTAATAPNSFDCVIMVNVLEHIEDDLAALRAAHHVLRSGGHLLLFVPALQFLMSRLDVLHGHYRRYTRSGLENLVSLAGGRIVVSRYFDLLGVAPWWMFNTIGRQTAFNPQLVRLYDRYGVPMTRFFESLVRPPFGKNIVLVSEF